MATFGRPKALSYFFLYLVASQSPLGVYAARRAARTMHAPPRTRGDEPEIGIKVAQDEFAAEPADLHSVSLLDQNLQAKKTPDLDWPGCKAWTKSGCVQGEGCHHEYIWLDTKRQSCRYTDEYKLLPDQVAKFFPTELARLEEKAIKFSKTGCIYGGWWMKCYRRMQQILRLFNYVNKAHLAVVRQGASHPAYQLVASEETKAKISQVTKNMGSGFSKHSSSKKFCFEAAIKKMELIPAKVLERKQTAIAAGQPLSEEELSSYEKAQQSAAMLAMTCTEVSDEQAQELQAQIEAHGDLKQDLDAEVASVDETIKENAEALSKLDSAGRNELQAGDEFEDVELDADDHEDLVPPEMNSLIEQHHNSASDINGSLVEQGSFDLDLGSTCRNGLSKGIGPVKWLWKCGLGWIASRTMWLIIYMFGSMFSIVRAGVVFPLLFVGCFLVKSLGWLFDDFLYGFLWEGDTKFLKTVVSPLKCAPWMWTAVGFKRGSGSFGDTVGQIVIQPAMFASDVTGVYHPYKSIDPPDPCKDVTCGINAYCSYGHCYCNSGFYPVQGGSDCGQIMTTKGCVCARSWNGGLFNSRYYGCSSAGSCKVDTQHYTYNTCKEGLKKKGIAGILSSAATGTSYKSYDSCTWFPTPNKVPKIPKVPKVQTKGV